MRRRLLAGLAVAACTTGLLQAPVGAQRGAPAEDPGLPTEKQMAESPEAQKHIAAAMVIAKSDLQAEAKARTVLDKIASAVGGRFEPVVLQPASNGNGQHKVKAKAYRVVERAGLVWVYMGERAEAPPLPGFEMPHPVVLAELEEGIRFLGPLKAEQRDRVAIGLPVSIEFIRRDGVALFQFVIEGEAR